MSTIYPEGFGMFCNRPRIPLRRGKRRNCNLVSKRIGQVIREKGCHMYQNSPDNPNRIRPPSIHTCMIMEWAVFLFKEFIRRKCGVSWSRYKVQPIVDKNYERTGQLDTFALGFPTQLPSLPKLTFKCIHLISIDASAAVFPSLVRNVDCSGAARGPGVLVNCPSKRGHVHFLANQLHRNDLQVIRGPYIQYAIDVPLQQSCLRVCLRCDSSSRCF